MRQLHRAGSALRPSFLLTSGGIIVVTIVGPLVNATIEAQIHALP